MMTSAVVMVCLLFSFTSGQRNVIYPSRYEQQQLATRINCQVDETQRFRYSSVTELWGTMGGQVILNADVNLYCLGDDTGGKYESQALKYLVEVSNLLIKEKKESSDAPLKRRKRGTAGEFFTKTWQRIKQFFKLTFGRGTPEPEVSKASQGDPVNDRKDVPVTDDSKEDFNMNDLLPLVSTPFQFVQLANGSIPEVRFAENEVDNRIKNFKRHLVDSFATQLNFNQRQSAVVEKSVMGEHMSTYNITVGGQKAYLNVAGWSEGNPREETVMVNKIITEGDILTLAPSEALNDRGNMQLTMHQVQIFQDGRMLSSSGTSSLALLHSIEGAERRVKRDASDIMSHFQLHSTFDIQLVRRQRRSRRNAERIAKHENGAFLSSSRFAEVEDSSERRKFRDLQKSTGNVTLLLETLLNSRTTDYDEKMQAIFQMVEGEVSLKLDHEGDSVSSAVRKLLSIETMKDMCARNFSICKDFLQLIALTGGSEAEKVLLFFLTDNGALSTVNRQVVADIISDISGPSAAILNSLRELIERNLADPDILGPLCLSLGYLGSKVESPEKIKISRVLTNLLLERQNRCHSDPLILDVLEALGNLGCENSVSAVLEVSANCKNDSGVQIASAHALRHSNHRPAVQEWVRSAIQTGDCEVIKAVVGSLTDTIQDQEMKPDNTIWPRFGFNDVDKILRDLIREFQCPAKDIILYFNRKRNSEANSIARSHFEPESELWNSASTSRQKRALWDDLNCREWTEDSKYSSIQDKEEFASDRATYNKRKSCLAFRRLGIKGANAEVYAGMFAGVKEPSEPPKYKLFTKFVSGLNFMGNQMEIGSFYFYHHDGRTKAYVRIMGRTRQEFTHDGCTPTDLKYRPLKHIPLYMVSVSNVQLSFGIHISSQLSLDTACPGNGNYQLEPMTDVRVGGEAMGTMTFSRGAVNLGANFNYKLQFTFTPTPDMCLKGSHGYDPMNVSFETYYQLWNAPKKDWGKIRTWKPNFLSWQVKRGNLQQWFKDTCISTKNNGPLNMEREVE